jgi:hypothetical protein
MKIWILGFASLGLLAVGSPALAGSFLVGDTVHLQVISRALCSYQ